MSDSDNELQSAMDSYMSQHSRKPNATQLSKFAGCKYTRASRFLRDNKSSSQPKASHLPRKINWLPPDEPSQPSTSSSYRATSKPKPKAKPRQQRSYSSAAVTSLKKSKKKRPCKKYQLDMLGAEFGACACGFSRAAHYDTSAFNDDSDDSDDDVSDDVVEQEQEQEQDYNQSYEPQKPVQHEEKHEEQEQDAYVNVNVEQEHVQDGGEADRLQDIITQLREQVVSMQQEINKSYQEKERLKKERDDEKNELMRTIADQDAEIERLSAENERLKGNDIGQKNVVIQQEVQYEVEQEVEEEPQKKGACNNYELDMTGAEFGSCKCGFSKAAHALGY